MVPQFVGSDLLPSDENSLFVSILVLGILNANHNLSIFADRMANANFEDYLKEALMKSNRPFYVAVSCLIALTITAFAQEAQR